MLKKAIIRGISGFAFSVTIGQFISIMISLSLGTGKLFQVTPEFGALFRTELEALIVQTLWTGSVGTVFAVSSLIFELDHWTSLKQYIVHFFITVSFWLPFVYICWKPQDSLGVFISFISFLVTYVSIWLTQYLITKNDIRKINERIQAENNSKEGV